MSHELRTPLNSVIGFANVLLKNRGANLSPQDLQFLSRIEENGRHLLGLINSILDLSKIEAGRVELEVTSVDLAALVRDTVLGMEGQAQLNELAIIADVPDGMMPIDTDQTKLKQMLINLIGNALKFTEKGAVTVRIAHDERSRRPLRIDVADSGIGIPKARLQAVFEAFQQADTSTSRQYGGTGLGLTITRSLAQLMGFDIQVASEVGVGSTFSIMLQPAEAVAGPKVEPVAAEAPAPVASFEERRDTPAGTLRLLTLIIDDDPDARIVLTQHLDELGCDVITAASADEGIALARRLRPDFITMDMMMPRKNGIEALREFKADPMLRDIPVAICSVVAEDHRGQVLGAVDCLSKPVSREALAGLLQRNVPAARSTRVLVVHSADVACSDYQELLKTEGVVVEVAAGVAAARASFAANGAPSLIVLDVDDPSTEIFPWIAAIREDGRALRVPLVLLVSDAIARATGASLGNRATVLPRSAELSAGLHEIIAGLKGRSEALASAAGGR
jgi:CheY-like chemotaxis protein